MTSPYQGRLPRRRSRGYPAYPHPPAMPTATATELSAPAPAATPEPRHSRGLIGAVVVPRGGPVASLSSIVSGITARPTDCGRRRLEQQRAAARRTVGGNGQPAPATGRPRRRPEHVGRPARPPASQQVGVVDIYTVQKYNSAAAAGTGIVLTSDGEILTNNHVIDGSTRSGCASCRRARVTSRRSSAPRRPRDVALSRLVNASGLSAPSSGLGFVELGGHSAGVATPAAAAASPPPRPAITALTARSPLPTRPAAPSG